MIVRAGTGWQYLLTDLSMILFMITASVLSQTEDGASSAGLAPSIRGEPLAVWRSGPDAPDVNAWIEAQDPDPRQQLTVVAHYAAGGQVQALDEARLAAEAAGRAGVSARIVVEPGPAGVVATLAYDVPQATMARDLQEPVAVKQPTGTPP